MERFIPQYSSFCCSFFNLEKIRHGFVVTLKINLAKTTQDKYLRRKDICS